jgi:hypothetical protein
VFSLLWVNSSVVPHCLTLPAQKTPCNIRYLNRIWPLPVDRYFWYLPMSSQPLSSPLFQNYEALDVFKNVPCNSGNIAPASPALFIHFIQNKTVTLFSKFLLLNFRLNKRTHAPYFWPRYQAVLKNAFSAGRKMEKIHDKIQFNATGAK